MAEPRGEGPDAVAAAACAALVEKGDPDRFLATMTAPPAARRWLWPLYAFNLEVARAPWVTAEPMIAEMRLQWWADALDGIAAGQPPRAHEVAAPLAAVIAGAGLPVAPLGALVEARRWDIWHEPFADTAALVAHIDATAGHLMWSAARVLGAPETAEGVVRDVAFAQGLAGWFRAAPALIAHGRQPLPGGDLAALAAEGLRRLRAARARRGVVPATAAPALRAGWAAGPVLAAAECAPGAIATGLPAEAEIARRFRLLRLAFTGRW